MTILEAIRNACTQCGLELLPAANVGRIEDALVNAGYSLDVDQSTGRLVCQQNGFPASCDAALKALARKAEFADVFEVEISRVTRASQLKTTARKCAFIKMHGLPLYEKLVGEKL
jgi:hypothetical protein